MVAPSPYDQLWRWKVEKWITGAEGGSLGGTSGSYVLKSGDTMSGSLTVNANINVAGNILPEATGTRNLGSATLRWGTIYTSDLSLNNGIGDWTIVEGASDLFITNNRTGRRYRFVLEPV